MRTHNFTQSRFLGAGLLEGFDYVTQVQEYVCRRCGMTISVPNCPKKTCLIFMSLDCPEEVERPKVIRTSPFEGRDDDAEEEKRTKHYQQTEKGKKQKKNQRPSVQW